MDLFLPEEPRPIGRSLRRVMVSVDGKHRAILRTESRQKVIEKLHALCARGGLIVEIPCEQHGIRTLPFDRK